MKKLLIIITALGCLAGDINARTLDTTITLVSSGSGTTQAGTRRILFIFSSDFVGTIAGVAFTGADDSSLELVPGTNNVEDVLGSVAYTVSAGSVRIVKLQ